MDCRDPRYFISNLFSIGVGLRMSNTLLFLFPLCQYVFPVWSCPPGVAEAPTWAAERPSDASWKSVRQNLTDIYLTAAFLLAPSSTKHLRLGLALSMSLGPFSVWFLAFWLPAESVLQNVLIFTSLRVTIGIGWFGWRLSLCIVRKAQYKTHQLTGLVWVLHPTWDVHLLHLLNVKHAPVFTPAT